MDFDPTAQLPNYLIYFFCDFKRSFFSAVYSGLVIRAFLKAVEITAAFATAKTNQSSLGTYSKF